MTNFPTSLDSLTNPTSTNKLDLVSHSSQHINANDAIEALEAKVGADGSAVTTSHDYKLSEVTSTDKAVGKTATQTLTNKTLTAPQINMGSDATGDMYYRNGSAATTRLPIGTTGQILEAQASGIPAWVANPSAVNASTTVKGVSEQATTAEINAGTATGSTGAVLFVSPDQLADSNYLTASDIVSFGGSGADGVLNVTSGTTTLDAGGAAVLIKNYTSINVSAGATLTISNKNAAGTILILKSQGAVTIAGTIELSGFGASSATEGFSIIDDSTHAGGTGNAGSGSTGGSASSGGAILGTRGMYSVPTTARLYRGSKVLACGSGGGVGGAGSGTGAGSGGAGGAGGGALIVECKGALTFSGTINLNGATGSNGTTAAGNGGGGGGGGGGAAGMGLIIYNTLTSNTGTINAKGGAGGNGGNGNTTIGAGGSGGAGAGSLTAAGNAGGAGGNANANGSNGTNTTNASGAGGGGGGGDNLKTGGTGGTQGSTDSNHYGVAANVYF